MTRRMHLQVGRALNHCELVVRRFYHRIFRSDEILVDPIVLERAMRGETKTESGSGGGGGGSGSGVEAGNGGSRDGGSATASSPPQQVAYQWVRHQKGGNMRASRSAEEGGMSRAHVGKPGVDLYLPLFFSQCLIGIYFLSVLDRLNTNVDSFGQGLASNQFPMEVSAALDVHPFLLLRTTRARSAPIALRCHCTYDSTVCRCARLAGFGCCNASTANI
jgi:hypothetical protein